MLGALGALEQVGQVLGQRRADAGGLLDGVGELGRVGGGQRHHRVLAGRATGPPPCPTAVCGSISIPVARVDAADLVERRVVVEAGRPERAVDPALALVGGDRRAARLAEPLQLLGGRPPVAPVQLEQQPLEVRRHLDVHARAERRHDRRACVMSPSSTKRVRMSLRFDAMTKPVDRRAHPPGDPAGEHVAEVAGRHART